MWRTRPACSGSRTRAACATKITRLVQRHYSFDLLFDPPESDDFVDEPSDLVELDSLLLDSLLEEDSLFVVSAFAASEYDLLR